VTDGIKILDAYWTERVNVLILICQCGCRFEHKASRWNVMCPKCGYFDHLSKIREKFVRERGRD